MSPAGPRGRARRSLRVATAALVALAALPPAAADQDAGAAAGEVPFAIADPELARLWRQGHALELEGRYLDSARAYAELARLLPGEPHLCWRIARNHYMAAKALSLSAKAERRRLLVLTEEWAARGSQADPRCAECALYRFVGLTQVASIDGLFSSARNAREMAALLERAFELGPTHVDSAWNSELANLHYAAGVFYRSVPENPMLGWTLGVRGDLERALSHLRQALAISPERVDYRLELGAALLCAAARRDDAALRAEGIAALEKLPALPTHQPSDAVDREHARQLIAEPQVACDYSREAFAEETPRP
jgi:tetratricopeptide (TPR) repeat protein